MLHNCRLSRRAWKKALKPVSAGSARKHALHSGLNPCEFSYGNVAGMLRVPLPLLDLRRPFE